MEAVVPRLQGTSHLVALLFAASGGCLPGVTGTRHKFSARVAPVLLLLLNMMDFMLIVVRIGAFLKVCRS